MRRTLSLVAVAVLVAVGCGSDPDSRADAVPGATGGELLDGEGEALPPLEDSTVGDEEDAIRADDAATATATATAAVAAVSALGGVDLTVCARSFAGFDPSASDEEVVAAGEEIDAQCFAEPDALAQLAGFFTQGLFRSGWFKDPADADYYRTIHSGWVTQVELAGGECDLLDDDTGIETQDEYVEAFRGCVIVAVGSFHGPPRDDFGNAVSDLPDGVTELLDGLDDEGDDGLRPAERRVGVFSVLELAPGAAAFGPNHVIEVWAADPGPIMDELLGLLGPYPLPEATEPCALFEQSEDVYYDLPYDTPAEVEAAERYYVAAFDRLAQMAPPGLEEELSLVADGSRSYSALIEELGWDLDAVKASDDSRGTFTPEEAAALEEWLAYCEQTAPEREDESDEFDTTHSEEFDTTHTDGEGDESVLPPAFEIPLFEPLYEAELRAYAEAIETTYLAGFEFERRLDQLEANCVTVERELRLTEIANGVASRPQFLPDFLVQHGYVCPEFVVRAGVVLREDRVFEIDREGLLAYTEITNPQVFADAALFDRFVSRLQDNCANPAQIRQLLDDQSDPPGSVIGWHAYVCPVTVTSLYAQS